MKARMFLLLLASLSFTSCMGMEHTVGGGPAGTEVVEERAWWMFWGLIPLSHVDSQGLAGPATSYRVITRMGFTDLLMNLPTAGFFLTQTIRVER